MPIDPVREIEEGLNVVEAWNGANAVICFGREDGPLRVRAPASPDRPGA
jgi:TnpA family transposase